jgi:hypothetical protein
MPPRKRAETKPAEPLAADPEARPEEADQLGPPDSRDPEEVGHADTPDAAATGDGKDPEKSDLQTVEQPCPVCFPNGWADGAFSHGCEHGTWIRDNT